MVIRSVRVESLLDTFAGHCPTKRMRGIDLIDFGVD